MMHCITNCELNSISLLYYKLCFARTICFFQGTTHKVNVRDFFFIRIMKVKESLWFLPDISMHGIKSNQLTTRRWANDDCIVLFYLWIFPNLNKMQRGKSSWCTCDYTNDTLDGDIVSRLWSATRIYAATW